MAEPDQRHIVTLVLLGVLVVLAFLGIVLFLLLHGKGSLLPAGIGWAAAVLVVAGLIVRRTAQSRQSRAGRIPRR